MAELRTFVIMVLTISSLALGIGVFATDMAGQYGADVKDVGFLSRANNTLETANSVRQQTESTPLGTVGFVFTAPLKAVQTVFNSLSTSIGLFEDMSSIIGVPTWFINLVSGIIIIVVTFMIISAYRKFKV